MFIKKYRSPGAVAGRSKWRRWAGLCRGLCGRDARAPRKPSSTQKTGNMVYFMPGNQARRLMQASSITPPLRGESARPGRSPQSSRWGANTRLTYKDNLHGWTGYTGWFDESFHRLEFDHHLFFNKDSENPLPSSLMTLNPHRIIARVSLACSSFPSCLSCLSMFLIMERIIDLRAPAPLPPPPSASAFACRLGFCDSPSRGE